MSEELARLGKKKKESLLNQAILNDTFAPIEWITREEFERRFPKERVHDDRPGSD